MERLTPEKGQKVRLIIKIILLLFTYATTFSSWGNGWNCQQQGETWVCLGDPLAVQATQAITQKQTTLTEQANEIAKTTEAVEDVNETAEIKAMLADQSDISLANEPQIPAIKPLPDQLDSSIAWAQCQYNPPQGAPEIIPKSQREQSPLYVVADKLDHNFDWDSILKGNVIIQRADQQLQADKVIYNKQEQTLKAQGQIRYRENQIRLHGDSAYVELNTDKAQMQNAKFLVESTRSRGSAQYVEIENQYVSHYQEIKYTTCQPGNQDWLLEAEKLTLDQEEGIGTARHAWLNFKGVPFLYTPYISFPLDDRRKSGFLAPTIGQSNETGTDIITPYYWNIAPDHDATLYPRYMSDRGFMLGGEFRYLTRNEQGFMVFEYLPDDKQSKEKRGMFAFKDTGKITPRLKSKINVKYVTDRDYFDDFGSQLGLSSTRFLERQATLIYGGEDWQLTGQYQYFQNVDRSINRANDPYSRFPQVLFELEKPDQFLGLTYHLRSEYVNFKKDNAVEADRIDIKAGVSLPWRNQWFYITPKTSINYTYYKLNDEPTNIDDTQNRTLADFSLDTGLFFDRHAQWAGKAILHTLEPRLYYLYRPHKNQDDIPIFDTAEYDFNFQQLFRENRFNGTDRLADANQLTAAMSSSVIRQETGTELIKLSLGQIFFFRDRKVNLPNIADDTNSSSAFIAELQARISQHWRSNAAIQYDFENHNADKHVFGIHYVNKASLFNVTYRRRDLQLEQTDVSFRLPITQTWRVVSRWQYSLLFDATIEAMAGLEYESCCWIARTLVRSYINDVAEQRNNSIYLQLELKGFTSFGDKIDKLLQRNVLGYQAL